jgi:hypothetical protein
MILFTTEQNYINIIDNDYQYQNEIRRISSLDNRSLNDDYTRPTHPKADMYIKGEVPYIS